MNKTFKIEHVILILEFLVCVFLSQLNVESKLFKSNLTVKLKKVFQELKLADVYFDIDHNNFIK